MEDTHRILLAPLVTEKASGLSDDGAVVAFRVALKASKDQIRLAVEKAFGVAVESVRTSIMPGKPKRRGGVVGRRPRWKKAVVSLCQDNSIDFYAAAE